MRRSAILFLLGASVLTSVAVAACTGGSGSIGMQDRNGQQLQMRLDGTATGNGQTCSWEGTAAYAQAGSSSPAGGAGPYTVGASFKSLDGCNDCSCSVNGIMCTMRACPVPTPGDPPKPCTTEAKVCPDGSSVGRTGPNCDFAACPTPGACFTSTGDLDPSMRTCSAPSDCVVVTFAQNCCGTLRAAGVNKASEARAQVCGNTRDKGFPACDCASQGTVADDGTTSLANGTIPGAASVTCSSAGQCRTTFASGSGLKWYTTCGGPSCQAPPADAGPPPVCPAAGSACTSKGQTCGNPELSCGSVLVCDDHDPKVGGCPISTRKAKEDIAYVDAETLRRLHDETLSMRLATYRYKGPFTDPKDPNATHLGFIVEDQPQSLSVDRGHDRVDLYGYMSMAVATMQVQEREIADLRKELSAVKAACTKSR